MTEASIPPNAPLRNPAPTAINKITGFLMPNAIAAINKTLIPLAIPPARNEYKGRNRIVNDLKQNSSRVAPTMA